MGKIQTNKKSGLYHHHHHHEDSLVDSSEEEHQERPRIKLVLKVPDETRSSKKPHKLKRRREERREVSPSPEPVPIPKSRTKPRYKPDTSFSYKNPERPQYSQELDQLSTSPLSGEYSPVSPIYKPTIKESHKSKKKKKKGKKEKSKKSKRDKTKKEDKEDPISSELFSDEFPEDLSLNRSSSKVNQKRRRDSLDYDKYPENSVYNKYRTSSVYNNQAVNSNSKPFRKSLNKHNHYQENFDSDDFQDNLKTRHSQKDFKAEPLQADFEAYTSPLTSDTELAASRYPPTSHSQPKVKPKPTVVQQERFSDNYDDTSSSSKRLKLMLRIPSAHSASQSEEYLSEIETRPVAPEPPFVDPSSPVQQEALPFSNASTPRTIPDSEQPANLSPCTSEFSFVSIGRNSESPKPVVDSLDPKNVLTSEGLGIESYCSSPLSISHYERDHSEVEDTPSVPSKPNFTPKLSTSNVSTSSKVTPNVSNSPKVTSAEPSPAGSQVALGTSDKPSRGRRKKRGGSRLNMKRTKLPVKHVEGETTGVAFYHKRLPRELKTVLLKLLEAACKRDKYGVFQAPVDPEEVPDYYKVISDPMDFGTMRTKVEAMEYRELDSFLADFKLVCNNAMTYNDSTTVYYKSANHILELGLSAAEKERPIIIPPSPLPIKTEPSPIPIKEEMVDIDGGVPPQLPDSSSATPKVSNHISDIPTKKQPTILRRPPVSLPHPTDGSFTAHNFSIHRLLAPSFPKLEPAWISRKAPPAVGSESRATYLDYASVTTVDPGTAISLSDAELITWGDPVGLSYGASLAAFTSGLGTEVETTAVQHLNDLSRHAYHLIRETRRIIANPPPPSLTADVSLPPSV